MTFNRTQWVRTARRLQEAIGYFELGMAEHALRQLESLDDWGPFEAAAAMLRAESLRAQQRYGDAAKSFEIAARSLPDPHDRPAWRALSQCLRQIGDARQAIESLAIARGAKLPRSEKPGK